MILLTASAKEHLEKMMKAEGASIFKLGLSKRGCSGYAYSMSVENEPGEGFTVVDVDGLAIAIEDANAERLDSVEIDWKSEGFGSRLAIENPKALSGCGCGSSFMFK